MTAAEAYKYAVTYGWSQVYENAVIAENNPRWALKFASMIGIKNIGKFTRIILKSNDPEIIVGFVTAIRDIPIKYINMLCDRVIDINDPKGAYHFAMYARQLGYARVYELQQIVMDSNDVRLSFYFAASVPKANISDLVDYSLIRDPARLKKFFASRPDIKERYMNGR